MRIFSSVYALVMKWVRHPHAPRYLFGLSFAESSFFPVPPDVMLAPMALAHPEKGYRYALLTTIASVLGGVFGWMIGYFALGAVEPLIRELGHWEKYQLAITWFQQWGFWAVLIAGFSPIPYKVFTIAAGALQMLLPLFVVASIIGRGARFYLVAALMKWGGAKMEAALHTYMDRIGWLTVLLLGIAYFTFV